MSHGLSSAGAYPLIAVCQFLSEDAILRAPMNEQSIVSDQSGKCDNDLLDPYDKLVSIQVLGKPVQVPERNRLLRCFQYLSIQTISYGDFCWNGECTNCQIWYHTQGQDQKYDKPALACRMEVIEGMEITRLSGFIRLEGINK